MLTKEIETLSDAELERLSGIIDAGKELRSLREQAAGYEAGHRARMDAIRAQERTLQTRIAELREGGAL